MNKEQARQLIKDTFQRSFDKNQYYAFARNLLKSFSDEPFAYAGKLIRHAFSDDIRMFERIGKYTVGDDRVDILVVHLKKDTSVHRARTMQRNFIAGYLQGNYGSSSTKDAALVAFVSPNQDDWRFSLVKLEFSLSETQSGRIRAKEEFTPARRYSFLVGANESCYTAQSRLYPFLENDDRNPTLGELEEAFNIETVTKEFFGKYRDLFCRVQEELDKSVKQDAKIRADFKSKGVDTVDFAKKLLGQIVFLYFLQKKGWFGVKKGEEWGSGSKHFLRELFDQKHGNYKNYFNDILEPLFYEALRMDRSHDDHYFSMFRCKIPFLNGGLFDPIGNYDWSSTDLLLPNTLFSNREKTQEGDIGDGVLDIFDRYNFTVKEDEPLEKEVAVDPEMLGKVFENLLEVKDRKSKGTDLPPLLVPGVKSHIPSSVVA